MEVLVKDVELAGCIGVELYLKSSIDRTTVLKMSSGKSFTTVTSI